MFFVVNKKDFHQGSVFFEISKKDFHQGSVFFIARGHNTSHGNRLTLVKPHAHHGNEISLLPNICLRLQCFI